MSRGGLTQFPALGPAAQAFPRLVFVLSWEARRGRPVSVEGFLEASRDISRVGGVGFRQACVPPCALHGSSSFPRTVLVWEELAVV
jgi:hypothetical protein